MAGKIEFKVQVNPFKKEAIINTKIGHFNCKNLQEIDDMNIDDLKAFKEINQRAELRDSCFKAILKALSK